VADGSGTAGGGGADGPVVVDDPAAARFELRIDGELAQLVYERTGDRLTLLHTEVPDSLGGRGLGGRLVRAALASAAGDGLTIVPSCPFARRWLEGHPDEAGAVTIDW
jgi:predicted GNAT family acetyltransferase